MGSVEFIQSAIIVMMAAISLMVAITLGLKLLRFLSATWYKRHFRRIEPVLERYILTGEEQPELLLLRSWQRDLFLSRLIVERMVLLKGAGREFLLRLAEELGLVDRYLKALKSRRRWRRARAAESLGYFGGDRSAGPLGRLLSDGDETIRAVAARALARIGNDEAVRLLTVTLDDPSELTRLRVAENLERVGRPAVEPLVASLSGVREGKGELHGPVMAARVLGNLRAAEARDVLRRAARDGSNLDLRAQATLALGKVGDPEDVPVLLEGARDEAWPVRAQAANALGAIGEVSAVPTLIEMAGDEAWWVRLNSCKALANMGPEGEKALLEILESDDRYARDRAAATLEVRGVTRRMVRNLAKPGKRGDRARTIVRAVIHSGSTRYLCGLVETLPEGEERSTLIQLLGEHYVTPTKPAEELEPLEVEPVEAEPAKVEAAGAEPPDADLIEVDPESIKMSLDTLPDTPPSNDSPHDDGKAPNSNSKPDRRPGGR